MRLFVALEITEEIRRAVATLVAELKPLCAGARWTRVEGMHVTLKFIGETPHQNVERLGAALGTIAPVGPIDLRFRNAGFFPNERRPRVVWAGIEASPNLAQLAAAVESSLAALGIPREERAFKPHLTLARFKTDAGLAALRDALCRPAPWGGALEFGAMRATEFHLFESRLKPAGAEYHKLASFPCTEAAP